LSQNILFEKDKRTLEDLFLIDDNYTFLVGAGISMNAPSNLPSAVKIVNHLISLCAPEEEIQKMQSLDGLRYEWLVEAIQEYVDKDLLFLDFFDHKDTPNLLHLFLAQEILRGNNVVTTNFDYMIEHALKQVVPEKDHSKISLIITKADFTNYPNPQVLVKKGKYPLYKIHGAKKNIMTNEDTKGSLVTTRRALGKHREEGETFAIEAFKKPAVHNLLKNRSLVVMGYSGSDDFDIGPMLKELPDLKRIIWIEHNSADTPEILKVNKMQDPNAWKNSSNVDQFLSEIRSDVNYEVIKITANTQEIIKSKLWSLLCPKIPIPTLAPSVEDALKFEEWIKPKYSNVPLANKYQFAGAVYSELQKNEDLLRCVEKALTFDEIINDDSMQAFFLSMMGVSLVIQFEYPKAVDYFLKALEIYKSVKDDKEIARVLINLAMVHEAMGKGELIQQYADQAIPIAEREKMYTGLSNLYNTLGSMYINENDFDNAISYLEKSNSTAQKAGEIMIRAINFNAMGMVNFKRGNIDEAIQKFEQALQIYKEFKGFNPDTNVHLALIYDQHKNEPAKAIEYLKKAVKGVNRFKGRGLVALMPAHYNISRLYLRLGDQEKAFEHCLQGLRVLEQPIIQQKIQELIAGKPQFQREQTLIAMELNKIAAEIYINQKNDPLSAIKCFQDIIKAAETFGGDALVSIPPTWLNIVRLYLQIDDQDNALDQCVQALQFMDKPEIIQKIQQISMTNMQYGAQHIQNLMEFYGIASELYSAKGNVEIATEYQKLYQQVQMSASQMGGSPLDQMTAQAMMNVDGQDQSEQSSKKKKKKKKKKK
jgi:tetratricopeptide (TPR) repeat protein